VLLLTELLDEQRLPSGCNKPIADKGFLANDIVGGLFPCRRSSKQKHLREGICKQTHHEGISRSYNPGSFGMTTRLKTKGSIDLKSKRPFSP
jgi:hypothetical protein